MNLFEDLKNPKEMMYADKIAVYILDNPEKFDELFEYIFSEDKSVAWRAGWICDKISRKYPELISPAQIKKIVDKISYEKHKGVLRSFLNIFYNLYEGTPLEPDFMNLLIEMMISTRSDVSHQVISMKILGKYCENEPDLRPEMLAYLELLPIEDFTAGFVAARKKMLKQLRAK